MCAGVERERGGRREGEKVGARVVCALDNEISLSTEILPNTK